MRVPTNTLWQSHDFDNAFYHILFITYYHHIGVGGLSDESNFHSQHQK